VLAALALGGHDLQRELLAAPVVRAREHDRQAVLRLAADEPQARLHARDALALAERDGDVLGCADADRRAEQLPATGQLDEPDLDAGERREPEELRLAPVEEDVDRDLEVRTVPRLQRAGDDRQVRRIGVEVLAQPLAQLRLGPRRVTLGPVGEPLDRVSELLGVPAGMLARTPPARRPCQPATSPCQRA
jgi:hypothetical protein